MARRSDHTRQELTEMILAATRKIVCERGQKSVSSRKIAREIGYTVGTVFQVFGNMDRLMGTVNMLTLDMLHAWLDKVPDGLDTEGRLRWLAAEFLRFAEVHGREWDAVISYPYDTDQTMSEDYAMRIAKLLDLIQTSIAPLYGADDGAKLQLDTRLLWTSMYGIFILASANRLTRGYDTETMISALIDMYISGRVD